MRKSGQAEEAGVWPLLLPLGSPGAAQIPDARMEYCLRLQRLGLRGFLLGEKKEKKRMNE